jgi:uncharacterized Zn finger protein
MAHCKNCGRNDATQIRTMMAAGRSNRVRCNFCDSMPEPRRRAHSEGQHHVPVSSDPISIEEARARTALALQSLN